MNNNKIPLVDCFSPSAFLGFVAKKREYLIVLSAGICFISGFYLSYNNIPGDQKFSFTNLAFAEEIGGSDNQDKLIGTEQTDTIKGFGGNDTIFGKNGGDDISGGDGSDVIYGDNGRDFLKGKSGDDRVEGGQGNDRIYGDSGNDILIGGPGNDLILGGPGKDIFICNDGKDTIADFNLTDGDMTPEDDCENITTKNEKTEKEIISTNSYETERTDYDRSSVTNFFEYLDHILPVVN